MCKKGGAKKKPAENVSAANGTNNVNKLGKGSGGYQPPTTGAEKIIDDWFEKHANKQWKDLLQSLNAEQLGTLHTLLTSGMQQQQTKGDSLVRNDRGDVTPPYTSPDTTHGGVTQGTNAVSTSKQTEEVIPEKKLTEKVIPEKKLTAVKTAQKVTPKKEMATQQNSPEKTPEKSPAVKVTVKPKVMPPKSSPEKSDDELQTENGNNGSKRHPTIMVCNDENCPLKKSPMGCGYKAAMRIRQRHISGLKKDPKKKLFPKNATPKKKSPKTQASGSPRRSPRLQGKGQQALLQIDWNKLLVSPENEVTVIIVGKPMKLRVVPENVQEKKDKKDDNFVAETSDSDTKSKPEMTVAETESEKEELSGSKSELITKDRTDEHVHTRQSECQ